MSEEHPNYYENGRLLESSSGLQSMLKTYRSRFLSVLDAGFMTQNCLALTFWNFLSG